MKKTTHLILMAMAALMLSIGNVNAQSAFLKHRSQEPEWGNFKQQALQHTRQQAKPRLPFLNVAARSLNRAGSQMRVSHQAGMPIHLPKINKKAHPALLASPPSGTQLWGNVIFRDDWDEYDAPYGFYSFDVSGNNISTEMLLSDYELFANGGGAFIDDVFHCVQYDVDPWGGMYAFYFKYDTTNWTRITEVGVDISEQWELIARCTAVDPTTQTVYGIFSTYGGAGMEFGTINYDDFSRTSIADVSIEPMAMACNSKGEIFVISQEGDLYRVDKLTGAFTLVGPTGFEPDAYLQSATFDLKDDHLYWAALRGDRSELLDVDTNTGKASKVADFPHFEEVLCLYAPFIPEDAAPKAVTGLAADFPNGALTGKITFVLPTQTVNGESITGVVGYEILIDGQSVATGQGEAGQSVAEEVTVEPGSHKIKVFTSNEAGRGEQAYVVEWIGPDTPPAISDLLLRYDASTSTATLTWTNPDKGINGGYIDADKLSYTITRFPGCVEVASGYKGDSFSETLEFDQLTALYYTIALSYDGMEGETSTSNHAIVGEALDLPYSQYFDSPDALDLFTIIDNNGNGNTWTLDELEGCASYIDGWSDFEGDDWLITPPVKMKSDRQYIVSFKIRNYWEWYNEMFATAIGKGDNPAEYTEVIPQTMLTSDKFQEFSNVVTVPEDGDYRYGIHAVSPSFCYGMLLDSLVIKEGAKFSAPDSVTSITVEPGAMGAKTASVTFTTPDKTANGQPLTDLSTVIITLDGDDTPVATLTNVSNLTSYTVQVDGIVGDGWHTFTVMACNNNGEDRGVQNSCVAWIGYDVPAAPTNVHMADNLDGTLTLTWEAPGAEGVHGGYVDASQLYYNIYSIVGFEMLEPVEMGIEGLKYVGELSQTGDQELLEWTVAACSAGGEGASTPANTLFSGAPYTLPFHESFAEGGTDMPIWGATESENGWCIFYPQRGFSADDDNGCITFAPYEGGETCTFYSGKISLQGTTHPMLSFSYYAVPGLFDKVAAYVRTPDGQRILLDETDFYALEGEEGWRRMGADLTPMQQYAYINVDFEGHAGEVVSPIYFDNINIRDAAEHDVLVKMEATENVVAGQDITAKVYVENIGFADISDMSVDFYVADQLVESLSGKSVGYLSDDTFTFVHTTLINDAEVLPVKAIVTVDGKTYATELINVNVRQPGYTRIEDLVASAADNGVMLQWTVPQYQGESIVESFEDYEPFSIGGVDGTFGEWRTVDGDKQYTAGFTHISYDNQYDPKGFMIFRPTDFWQLVYPQLSTLDGAQYIAAFSPELVNADDWLISPALSGAQQTVSMYVRSYTENTGLEDFEVRYSTEGNDTANFTTVAYQGQAPLDWTEIQVELPEGATHFAIHYTSKTKVMLMLDDVAFEKGDQTVTGFRVYRDGKAISELQAEATQFVDTTVEDGNHTYNVTILYATGESAFSNDASIIVDQIDMAQLNNVGVKGSHGSIMVLNANELPIEVFTAEGALMYKGVGKSNQQPVNVKRGHYLVKVSNKVFNVMVD